MNALRHEVEAVLARCGLELVDISQTKAGSRVILRITVDGDGQSGTGLNLDEVAEASQEISQVLDDTNVMGNAAYVLEVGTPGVDRPLTHVAHWRRNLGRLVTITTTDAQVFTDRILSVEENQVTLSDKGSLPYADIKKAKVQVEMNRDEDAKE